MDVAGGSRWSDIEKTQRQDTLPRGGGGPGACDSWEKEERKSNRIESIYAEEATQSRIKTTISRGNLPVPVFVLFPLLHALSAICFWSTVNEMTTRCTLPKEARGERHLDSQSEVPLCVVGMEGMGKRNK
jgi:hypothetical protein